MPLMTPAAAQRAPISPNDELYDPAIWCVNNSQGNDWTKACFYGEKACEGGHPYNPGLDSSEIREGYDANWVHAGCSSQK
jgi:hypothetical protein